MTYDVHPDRPLSLTPARSRPGFDGAPGHRDSSLPMFPPFIWRVINDLHEAGQAQHGSRPVGVVKVMRRQGVDFDVLKRMEEEDIIRAWVGAEWIDVELKGLTWRQVTSARGNAKINIGLTDHGKRLAFDPLNLVLRSAWRAPRRYTVADVTSSAGISGADVKPVLTTLEALGLLEAVNDQGVVQLAMWKRSEIPPSLRLRLTRRGGTYLNRK